MASFRLGVYPKIKLVLMLQPLKLYSHASDNQIMIWPIGSQSLLHIILVHDYGHRIPGNYINSCESNFVCINSALTEHFLMLGMCT